MSNELMKENIKRAQAEIAKKREEVSQGAMRQKYHFMTEAGWLNDPNGLIFFKGKYHFFYQYNPYDSFWGSMHWGHAISDDMLHWEYLPLALAPSETYDNHPKGGCFSGSAIEHEGRLYLLYTASTNYGDGLVQNQCMAYSDDGFNFIKSEKNPVIAAPPIGYEVGEFRDPKVWKHGEYFYLVCAGKKNDLGQALLYRSKNLEDWTFFNILAESRGELGYMWECPDFFPLKNADGEKYVLTFSPMGVKERTSIYLVGDMNYETGKFNYSTVGNIDWGFDYYAPQSFVDQKGRRILVAWANSWEWMPWWKDWGPTFKEGWCGSFNLPREAILDSDNTVKFVPIEELAAIRKSPKTIREKILVEKDDLLIPTENGNCFELKMSIDLTSSTAGSFELKLRSNDRLSTNVTFDLKKQMMFVNRENSDDWSQGETKSNLLLKDKTMLNIHLFVDQSSIEIFTDDYKTSHSLNVFAAEDQNKNYVSVSEGKLVILELETWELDKTM
ncbi:glycoside hydrolase family 32 protein [Candidatus Enterococcus murrayae]|uniref:Sucrose-6-phosphate hydrolase n=1 Tax=Candidatus Enterococcus murrayae TaxID=2815321 RepID=A0ABS3HDQ0_9ENTE|nr:glycoside hydrolase family 32 protein [Enterococcus sp. MJM16]MBO0451576.1 glycoside hydrolase family 32 protein [Enterococcus sp. MJM16]